MHRMIVDGFNLAYRSHYAHVDWVTKSGLPSGCFYGFLSSLQSLKNRFPRYHVTVVWDTNATRKKAIFAEYKANRQAFSIDQPIADLKMALSCVEIWQAEFPGEEADDVIATMAAQFNAQNDDVCIYGRDKDMLQLVEDGKVVVLWPRVGKSSEIMFDEARVKAEFGVSPKNIPCLLCLRGDTSDNIPGVPRVPTTILAGLAEKYGTPEKAHDGLSQETLTMFQLNAIMAHKKQASLNWQLIKLVDSLEPVITKGISNANKLIEIMLKYEVKSISADKFVDRFGNETQFLERRTTPAVICSLFDEEKSSDGTIIPSSEVR